MDLDAVFPRDDFWLLAVIVGLPLVGAAVNGLFGKRLGREAVTTMALSVMVGAFLASVLSFFRLRAAQAEAPEEHVRFLWKGWEWLRVSGRNDLPVPIELSFSVDALSSVMILVITGVGLLIHLYSTKYMEEDEGYWRFFAYLNLFVFSMLVLVLGDSLPVLFVGWEGVGLCSYLLIGFWYQQDANAAAGKKAFIANRIGDFGLLVAMGLLVFHVGALDWKGIEQGVNGLMRPVQIWPIGSHVPVAAVLPESWAAWVNAPRYTTAATLVSLFLFLGACGKSAQIPLYVWLPDAMAGPTPVSALIHAATMVTAGVYLVCRLSGVFVLSASAMFTVALVGAATAFFAATIALVQNDIKKVLAYSTVSQLGYMFLGAGVGAFSAGFFHVVTHAFFKACLFLGAGSVIHAMHARIHDTEASQDLRNMGGLRKYLPVTFATFAAAWAAIVGFPLTSGFFSKDEILFKAWTSQVKSPVSSVEVDGNAVELFAWPSWGPAVLYGLGVGAALLTAFYMTRLLLGIFSGEFKGWAVVPGWKAPEGEHHHEEEGELEGPEPHESPWQMTLPLVILGALAVVAGALNAHALFHSHLLDDFLGPVFAWSAKGVVVLENAKALEIPLLLPGVAAFAGGVGAAWWMYEKSGGVPAAQLAERFPALHALLYDKWRVDELYEETVLGAVDSLAELSVLFDKYVVDGLLARVTAALVAAGGAVLRLASTGRTHAYAAFMVLGVAGIAWWLVTPSPQATVAADHASGQYTLTAAPGYGHEYRWTVGDAEAGEFGPTATQSVAIDVPGESKRVRLEVRNAFGRTRAREFVVHRPKPDLSGALGAAEAPSGAALAQRRAP